MAWTKVLHIETHKKNVSSDYSTRKTTIYKQQRNKNITKKNRLKQFLSTKSALLKALEGKLKYKEKGKYTQKDTRNK